MRRFLMPVLSRVARLHLADHAGAVFARVSQFVQLFAVPRADKAALFGADRRIFHKGALQQVAQSGKVAQRGIDVGDGAGRKAGKLEFEVGDEGKGLRQPLAVARGQVVVGDLAGDALDVADALQGIGDADADDRGGKQFFDAV